MAFGNKSKRKDKKRRLRRRRVPRLGEPTGVDLIEEGVHLLRRLGLRYWTVYLLGAVPFTLGFLYFWAEMANSGLAESILLPASAGMAVLFIWMKFTQSFFAMGLRFTMLGEEGEKWSLSPMAGVFLRQAFWQPTGLIVLPLAAVVTLPFAWCFAFYQNLTVADPLRPVEAGYFRENWRLARMWHEQNWMLITLLSLVFLLVWLNCLSIISVGPFLLKSLLGIETLFSKVGGNLFNSTTFFSCFMVSYLVTDPLAKAVYLLRRHYCESRQTGADLQLRLRRFRMSGQALALLLLALLAGCLWPQANTQAAESKTQVSHLRSSSYGGQAGFNSQVSGLNSQLSGLTAHPSSLISHPSSLIPQSTMVQAEELDASIEDVMQRREFVWRFPREEEIASGEHWLASFIDKIEAFQERISHWLEKFFKKQDDSGDDFNFDGDLSGLADLISYLLIGGFVLLVLYFAVRAWRVYRASEITAVEDDGEETVVPDLESDEVDASLLPRNRWVELARELIAKGDYRLALRAYFLAQLSAFSSEGLIHVRSAKSNREYARELARRGHTRADLLPLYQKQVRLFESVWYGGRPAQRDEIFLMEEYLKGQGVLS